MTDNKKNNSGSKANIFEGFLGPLSFPKMNPIPGQKPEEITTEDILQYLCSENVTPEIDNFKESYKNISENINKLFIVPTEYEILNKLIYPLRRAIGSYMVGNYLGTIALCGMVSEMAIIFHYDTLKIKINEQDSEEIVKKLFDNKFENLGQRKRVKFLQALGYVSDELVTQFDIVRNCRKQYLHFLSKKHENIALDAKKTFDATLNIVVKILGVGIGEPGRVVFNQNVINYLIEKRILKKEK